MPPGSLSVTLRPSRAPVSDNCRLLSKPVVRVPVSVSGSRSTRLSGSLRFSEPSGLSLDSGFSVSHLAPSLAELSSSPRPAEALVAVQTRAQRPPEVSAPGARSRTQAGAGGGSPPLPSQPEGGGQGLGSEPGSAESSPPSGRPERGAAFVAGGKGRAAGSRARVPRRLLPAGRAARRPSALPAKLPAATGPCGRLGARPQPVPEEVSAGARPARTPPPAAPARGVRSPPPAPGPRGEGQTPPPPPF